MSHLSHVLKKYIVLCFLFFAPIALTSSHLDDSETVFYRITINSKPLGLIEVKRPFLNYTLHLFMRERDSLVHRKIDGFWEEKKLVETLSGTISKQSPLFLSLTNLPFKAISGSEPIIFTTPAIKTKKVFIPFLNSLAETTLLEYKASHILKKALIRITDGVDLGLTNISKDLYDNELSTPSSYEINPSWFSGLESTQDEFKNLVNTFKSCKVFFNDLNTRILKSASESSYKFHRQAIQLEDFCTKVSQKIESSKSANIALKEFLIKDFSPILLSYLQHTPQKELTELARDKSYLILFEDKSLVETWPKAIRYFIATNLRELEQVFKIEELRKVRVELEIKNPSFSAKTVFRTKISLISTLDKIPVLSFQDYQEKQQPLEYDREKDIDKEAWCSKNKNSLVLLVSKNNESDLFPVIKEALASPSCHQISLLTKENIDDLKERVNLFEHNLFQDSYEMQLSNYTPKSLRIIPGRYFIIINSMISGDIISRQEFTIPKAQNVKLKIPISNSLK